MQHPSSSVTTVQVATENIYGRVYTAGITEGSGQGNGIITQLGYGSSGSDPSAGGWSWVDATYNAIYEGDEDEYYATLTINTAGTYAYAYRFSGDDGLTWMYGDLSGCTSSDPYDPAEEGSLTVNP